MHSKYIHMYCKWLNLIWNVYTNIFLVQVNEQDMQFAMKIYITDASD